MNLQDLINNPPLLHEGKSGELISWGLHNDTLHYIDQHVNETSKTLETGAGISTILFALKATNHICIVPNQRLIDRIKQYCIEHQISTEKIDFQLDRSENVLPSLDVNDLDLVLIDGRHAFPSPFIDWYYTSSKVKINGIVIVDNTELWTGMVLKKFLLSEKEWQFQQNFLLKSAAFMKLTEYSHLKSWSQQAYVARNSRHLIAAAKIRQAFMLWRKGEFSTFFNKIIRNLGT